MAGCWVGWPVAILAQTYDRCSSLRIASRFGGVARGLRCPKPFRFRGPRAGSLCALRLEVSPRRAGVLWLACFALRCPWPHVAVMLGRQTVKAVGRSVVVRLRRQGRDLRVGLATNPSRRCRTTSRATNGNVGALLPAGAAGSNALVFKIAPGAAAAPRSRRGRSRSSVNRRAGDRDLPPAGASWASPPTLL